ncbi:MAG TPA: hypothetical protein VIH27_03780 [Nitrososphaerales archaeon]
MNIAYSLERIAILEKSSLQTRIIPRYWYWLRFARAPSRRLDKNGVVSLIDG